MTVPDVKFASGITVTPVVAITTPAAPSVVSFPLRTVVPAVEAPLPNTTVPPAKSI